jgi:hypothetical protein
MKHSKIAQKSPQEMKVASQEGLKHPNLGFYILNILYNILNLQCTQYQFYIYNYIYYFTTTTTTPQYII